MIKKKLEKENQTDHGREEDEVHRGKWDRKEETAKTRQFVVPYLGIT